MKRTTLCYIRQNGMWLMLYRNRKPDDPNEGKWIGIGGRIEEGETPDQCNRREVCEETGLKLRSAHFHGVIRFRSDEWEAEDMYLYSSEDVHRGAGPGMPVLPDCDEGELRWIPEEELMSLPMWEGDRAFLEKIMAGQDRINMTLK